MIYPFAILGHAKFGPVSPSNLLVFPDFIIP
ncbi:hypothetical protein V1288_004499 [Bradyrhizobium sp. AZCC 2176]